MNASGKKPLASEWEQALKASRCLAPPDFTAQVLAALPPRSKPALRDYAALIWPARGQWLAPAFAGALAVLVLLAGWDWMRAPSAAPQNRIAFEVRLPEAQRVELVGSFNNWRKGEIFLKGPDAAGYWSVEVPLSAGRHEYLFLVDGREWVTDPSAVITKPDGFGNHNAVMELLEPENDLL